MPEHLDVREQVKADQMKNQGKEPKQILEALQKQRSKEGKEGPSKSAVYNFLGGNTFKRSAEEKRGRPGKFTPQMLKVLNQVRLKLLKEANNEWHVTWADICKEGFKILRKKGLWGKKQKSLSSDCVARNMRSILKIKKRPCRKRIARTKGDEERRYEQALRWVKRPASFWSKEIHAFIDNRIFVAPGTEAQKKQQCQAKVA